MPSFAKEMRRAGRTLNRQLREARRNAIAATDQTGAGLAAGGLAAALALLGVAHASGSAAAAAKAAASTPPSGAPPGGTPNTPSAPATSPATPPASPATPATPAAPPPALTPTSPATQQTSITGAALVGTPMVPTSAAYNATDTVGDTIAIGIFESCATILYGTWAAAQNPVPTPMQQTLSNLAQWVQTTYGSSATPPLRTDGVLDWRTWGLAVGEVVSDSTYLNSQAFITEFGQTPQQIGNSPLGTTITDSGLVGLAQNAVAIILASSTATASLGIPSNLPASAQFGGVIAAIQSKVGEPISNGVLDYWTLSVIVALAYVML